MSSANQPPPRPPRRVSVKPPSQPPEARPTSQPPAGSAPSYPPAPPANGTRVMPTSPAPARRVAGAPLGAAVPTSHQPGSAPPRPPGGQWQGPTSPGQSPPVAPPRRRRRGRRVWRTLSLLLVLVLIWPVGLGLWANSRLQHVEALSDMADTPGRTYLIAGSDQRGSGGVNDTTEGARADTIMLVHVSATNGQAALVSIPRDTYAQIPGYGGNKINAALAFGGPALLVQTVEGLTGFKVDHYVEVGFGSVTELVEAVGGVELCLDQDVSDQLSKLEWQAGCHMADGQTALAFSRMRYADPRGDLGRVERQRQVVGQVMKRALTPRTLLWPPNQIELVNAGTAALVVDESMNILSLGRLFMDFRKATGPDGVMGTPPIASTNYQPGGIGSAVLLDEARAAQAFAAIAEGTWEPDTLPE